MSDEIDERYNKSKIYTITCNDGYVYVGSTIKTLNTRFKEHIYDKDCSMYKYIAKNYDGDWSKSKIELYENYECKSKKELERREGEIIRLIGTINKVIAGRTYKEWYKDNNKQILLKHRIYYQNNIEKINKYYEENKEKISEYHKQYREDNIEKISKYYEDNKDHYKEYERNRHNKAERAEYGKEIVECECSCISTRQHLARHRKSQKHQDLLLNQTTAILSFLKCF